MPLLEPAPPSAAKTPPTPSTTTSALRMTPSQQRTAAARRAPGRPVLLALLLWGAIGLPQRADGLANEYCSSWSALTTGGSSTSACPPCSKIGGDPCKAVDGYWTDEQVCMLPVGWGGSVVPCGAPLTTNLITPSGAIAGRVTVFQTVDWLLFVTYQVFCPYVLAGLRPPQGSTPFATGLRVWNDTRSDGSSGLSYQYADLFTEEGVYTCMTMQVDLTAVCNPRTSRYSLLSSAWPNKGCACLPSSGACPPSTLLEEATVFVSPLAYATAVDNECSPAGLPNIAPPSPVPLIADVPGGGGTLPWSPNRCSPPPAPAPAAPPGPPAPSGGGKPTGPPGNGTGGLPPTQGGALAPSPAGHNGNYTYPPGRSAPPPPPYWLNRNPPPPPSPPGSSSSPAPGPSDGSSSNPSSPAPSGNPVDTAGGGAPGNSSSNASSNTAALTAGVVVASVVGGALLLAGLALLLVRWRRRARDRNLLASISGGAGGASNKKAAALADEEEGKGEGASRHKRRGTQRGRGGGGGGAQLQGVVALDVAPSSSEHSSTTASDPSYHPRGQAAAETREISAALVGASAWHDSGGLRGVQLATVRSVGAAAGAQSSSSPRRRDASAAAGTDRARGRSAHQRRHGSGLRRTRSLSTSSSSCSAHDAAGQRQHHSRRHTSSSKIRSSAGGRTGAGAKPPGVTALPMPAPSIDGASTAAASTAAMQPCPSTAAVAGLCVPPLDLEQRGQQVHLWRTGAVGTARFRPAAGGAGGHPGAEALCLRPEPGRPEPMPLVVDPEGHSRLVRDTDEDRQSCRTATTANGAATDQEPYLQAVAWRLQAQHGRREQHREHREWDGGVARGGVSKHGAGSNVAGGGGGSRQAEAALLKLVNNPDEQLRQQRRRQQVLSILAGHSGKRTSAAERRHSRVLLGLGGGNRRRSHLSSADEHLAPSSSAPSAQLLHLPLPPPAWFGDEDSMVDPMEGLGSERSHRYHHHGAGHAQHGYGGSGGGRVGGPYGQPHVQQQYALRYSASAGSRAVPHHPLHQPGPGHTAHGLEVAEEAELGLQTQTSDRTAACLHGWGAAALAALADASAAPATALAPQHRASQVAATSTAPAALVSEPAACATPFSDCAAAAAALGLAPSCEGGPASLADQARLLGATASVTTPAAFSAAASTAGGGTSAGGTYGGSGSIKVTSSLTAGAGGSLRLSHSLTKPPPSPASCLPPAPKAAVPGRATVAPAKPRATAAGRSLGGASLAARASLAPSRSSGAQSLGGSEAVVAAALVGEASAAGDAGASLVGSSRAAEEASLRFSGGSGSAGVVGGGGADARSSVSVAGSGALTRATSLSFAEVHGSAGVITDVREEEEGGVCVAAQEAVLALLQPGQELWNRFRVTGVPRRSPRHVVCAALDRGANAADASETATHTAPHQVVLLKFIHDGVALQRQASLLQDLAHSARLPRLVHLAAAPSRDVPTGALAVEHGSRCLAELLRRSRPQAPVQQLLLLQVMEALADLHAAGWAHGAVHPARVWWFHSQGGGAGFKLAGGLSHSRRAALPSSPTTHSGDGGAETGGWREAYGAVEGGAAYVAPEQLLLAPQAGQGARAGPYPDEAADCWAAGVLAHEVLTGQPLFGPRGASRGGGELAASPSLPSFEQVAEAHCLGTPLWFEEQLALGATGQGDGSEGAAMLSQVPQAVEVLRGLLCRQPERRMTAAQAAALLALA